MLREETRNVDLWLELASLYDEPERKREILRGVLLIDPRNMAVQAGLDEIDGTAVAPGGEPTAGTEVSEILVEDSLEEPVRQEFAETPAFVQRPPRQRGKRSRRTP